MYLYLGGETVVPLREIVGIFDLDKTSTGAITREYLKSSEQKMRVTAVTNELPKSFVVCEDVTGERVYLSQIAPQTLKRRSSFIDNISTDE